MENTVKNFVKVLEGGGVDKEGGDKVNLVVCELIDELGLPALGGGTTTELAGVSGEGGGEDITIVLQLAGVVGITSDVVTERTGVIRGGAWHHTVSRSS